MTPTERQRIVEEAEKYGFQVPYDGSSEFYDRSAVKAYITGATAWHDKARNQAIDEIIDIYLSSLPVGDCKAWDFVKHAKEFITKLESLKTKP